MTKFLLIWLGTAALSYSTMAVAHFVVSAINDGFAVPKKVLGDPLKVAIAVLFALGVAALETAS